MINPLPPTSHLPLRTSHPHLPSPTYHSHIPPSHLPTSFPPPTSNPSHLCAFLGPVWKATLWDSSFISGVAQYRFLPCMVSISSGFLHSRFSMYMWYPDDIGRDSWVWVVASALLRA